LAGFDVGRRLEGKRINLLEGNLAHEQGARETPPAAGAARGLGELEGVALRAIHLRGVDDGFGLALGFGCGRRIHFFNH